ncbi:glycoside hydrolase superfamily [Leucosporidium creatinivorum]|uniref:Glycoside hydrolase superfamily n=1 Tax=Leucosporidium creatinivorum TaxID=106004 RepID=A0A1Y2FX62_9BASI|nr:glycoside hydrolase superfamily [Leucosporidium creatinivorum]
MSSRSSSRYYRADKLKSGGSDSFSRRDEVNYSSDSDLEKARRSSEEDSSLFSAPSTDSDSEYGDERPRKRFVSSRRAPSPSSSTSNESPLSSRNLVLFLGTSFILCLTFLAGFAINKYVDGGKGSAPSEGRGGSAVETVTVTVAASTGVEKSTSTATTASKGSASSSSSKGSATTSPSASSSSKTGASSKGSTGSGTFPGLSKNGIGIGMLPDYQDQTLGQINEGLGFKSSFFGWYAQLPESGEWDGGQLLGSVLEDLKASGAIFQPAVMPNKNNWNGLSPDDDYQARAIATVMKKFTDEGIEVWLRFAHEVNWYQSDGTYSGGVDEFKKGWAAVSAAVADNDMVKMFYTPNVAASLDDYVRYFPDDLSTVQYIGIDYYPKSSSESFVEHMKPFYDKYCVDGSIKFAMGETGTMWEASIEEKLAWMEQMTSKETAEAMPHYVGTSWFNYDKEQAFKLWKSGSDSDNAVSKEWFATDTSAEGAAMGNA